MDTLRSGYCTEPFFSIVCTTFTGEIFVRTKEVERNETNILCSIQMKLNGFKDKQNKKKKGFYSFVTSQFRFVESVFINFTLH